jgi:AbrB family looped-hinge helix DNA binding protein
MTTLTITAKGQVTLKKDVLEHLGVRPGDKIDVRKLPGGRIEVAPAPKGKISDVYGMLYDPNGPSFTIEEIKGFTERAWAGDFGDDDNR